MPAFPMPPKAIGPIIVIGMHRSGTSLLVSILKELGTFFGAQLDPNQESQAFLEANRTIMRLAHARWDCPHNMRLATSQTQLMKLLGNELFSLLGSSFKEKYWGKEMRSCFSGFEKNYSAWGWKDPRNTFTLPLWVQLFPGARVIHIYRNGVDTAFSLLTREKERLGDTLDPDLSPRCLTLQNCFELWKEYVSMALVNSSYLPRVLKVSYETLLAHPEPWIFQLAEFCGVKPKQGDIHNCCQLIDPDKAWQYQKNEYLRSFFDTVSGDPVMQNLGYTEHSCNDRN